MDIDRGFGKELFLDCVSWGVIAYCFVQSCTSRLIYFVNCLTYIISSIQCKFFVCLAGCTGKGLSRPEFSVTTKQHQKYVPVKEPKITVNFVTKKDIFLHPVKMRTTVTRRVMARPTSTSSLSSNPLLCTSFATCTWKTNCIFVSQILIIYFYYFYRGKDIHFYCQYQVQSVPAMQCMKCKSSRKK